MSEKPTPRRKYRIDCTSQLTAEMRRLLAAADKTGLTGGDRGRYVVGSIQAVADTSD